MNNILQELNKEIGVKGSMVITPDGFLVSSSLGPDLEEDLVAAIVSSVLLSVNKTLNSLESTDKLSSCVFHASQGKIMFYDVGNTFLVVVADTTLELDNSKIAIRSAIHRIKNRRVG